MSLGLSATKFAYKAAGQPVSDRAAYEVTVAPNGRDAKAAIERIEPFDVVVLDLMLPYISGYQLITEIRDSPTWQYVPIVVVSGKVLEEDIVRALNLGASDYVTKPFRPEELLGRATRLTALADDGHWQAVASI